MTDHSNARHDNPLDGNTPPSLARISQALGCEVGAFFDGEVPTHIAQLVEITALWPRLKDSAVRDRILQLVRENVDPLPEPEPSEKP